MKIILIGTAYPFKGGIATFNERFVRELQQNGHEVEIVTFTLQYPAILYPGKSQKSSLPAPQGLRIKPKLNNANPINWIQTGNYIRKQKPDLVLIRYWIPFMGPSFGTVLRRIKKDATIKIIAILDNAVPHEHRPGDKAFTKYFLAPVDGFVSMSQQVLKDLTQFNQTKPRIRVDHPIYDVYGENIPKAEARKILNIPQDEKIMLFFGYIRKYKGLDLLLEAMALSPLKDSGIKLLLAGEFFGNEKEYREQIQRLGLTDRIYFFTEFIPNDEVRNYFCATDAVVLPYRSATQSGITQIAYYFEKPMIATRVGGLPEIVNDGQTGLLMEPEPAEIAKTIVSYFEKDLENEFLPHLKEEKKKYSWAHFVDQILDLYHKL